MKRIALLLSASILAFSTINAQKTLKDGNVELREASNFTGIDVSGGFDVFLTNGTEETVGVSASNADYQKYIKVEVKNGVLHIYFKPNSARWNVRNLRLKAYISYKTLNKLSISGATDVRLMDTWRTTSAHIELSGASDLVGAVDFEEARVNQNGASDMRISGTVGKINVDLSGASTFKGYELATQYCNARASGASDIRITVNKELSVNVSGASDVYYRGEALIRDIKTSGASSVAKR